MGAGAARAYHGLNGSEVKIALLTEMKSELTDRLSKYWQTALRVQYAYRMHLECYPSERPLSVSLSGSHDGLGSAVADKILADVKANLDRNTDFGHNVAFPKVTWTHTIDMSAFALPETVLPERPVVREVTPGEVDLRVNKPLPDPSALVQHVSVDAASADVVRQREIAAVEACLRELRGEPVAAAPVSTTVAPRTGHLDNIFQKTGTDLDITGGPRAIPQDRPIEAMVGSGGGGSAVAPLAVPMERMTASVAHPSLAEGGIGSPDAARREMGVAVPTPTRVAGGHIVDFPLGQL